jgi:hypothetical protein
MNTERDFRMKIFTTIIFTTFVLALLAFASAASPSTATGAVRHHRHHIVHRRAVVDHSVRVWVNTKSGVYHYPGERWYGRTEEGEYMTESAARAAGYRPTENGQ